MPSKTCFFVKKSMKAYPLAIILVILMTYAIDILLWRHITKTSKRRKTTTFLYWSIPTFFTCSNLVFLFNANSPEANEHRYYIYTIINGIHIAMYIAKITSLVTYNISVRLSKHKKQRLNKNSRQITRAEFMGKLTLLAGALPFAAIIYNITNKRFRFNIYKEMITFNSLPKNLEGLKIIQLSDLHLGNYNKKHEALDGVINAINNLEADLIFITGDFVNNFASETLGWDKSFKKLKAKHGKYAVLGNHDYGDYSQWKTPQDKQNNLDAIKKAIDKFGFNLLLNTTENININNETISIIGVENWGHPPFPRYGNLKEAMRTPQANFKILLSHDPDHWEAEVAEHTNIDLCLAGHTHGMQLGLTFNNKQWSPAKWKYKHWGGLYKNKEQYLYVNRGLGCIGMPLRIGMPPEITELILLGQGKTDKTLNTNS